MADVNKNIINAYRSMYESKEEVLDETNKNDKSDDGEGLDAVQPKAVKKKFADRKDKDIDNDGDVDSSDEYLHKRRKAVSKAIEKEGNAFTKALMAAKEKGEKKFKVGDKEYDVQAEYIKRNKDGSRGKYESKKESFTREDIRAMCHSKDHDCATYVEHPEWGLGKPVYESHAIPDDNGYVEWYDVEFAHGIEREVPAKDMKILDEASHGKKKKEPMKDDMDNGEEEEPKMMDSDENPMKKKKKVMVPDADKPSEDDAEEEKPKVGVEKPEDKKKKKTSGNSGEKEAEISKIGEQVSEFTNLLNELMAVDAIGKKKKEKDGSEPDERDENNPEGEKDFVDAHGKKDVVVDGEKAIDDTSKTAKDTKQGKHVKQQQAKGDSKPIKSTEAPVKGEKEPKEGEGKKSIKTESTLMDMALQALKGKTVPEMKQIIASTEKEKNPFDARTKDAKAFLERMHKRKNGDKGTSQQYKDKDPKDLPVIKGEKDKEKEVKNIKSLYVPRANK